MKSQIAVVVEGHGEVAAAPVLIRRLLHDAGIFDVEVLRPFRRSRGQLLKDGGIEGFARLAVAAGTTVTGLLVLLDADDDCPKELGPALQDRAASAVDCAVEVVAATREYEAWFLASAPSLRGLHGLACDLQAPPNPEDVRGAKEWLTRHMAAGLTYKETRHQAALSQNMDLELAATARSFRKMRSAVRRVSEPSPR